MPNKPNRRSIRLQGYDYSQEGLYFITLCCQDRICRFGEVVNGEMILNEVGKIAELCWLQIPEHFTNTVLHEFVIMPNHLHGIVKIVGAKHLSPLNDIRQEEKERENNWANRHLPHIERTIGFSQNRAKDVSQNRAKDVSLQHGTSKTIGSIVRGFKVGVTKWVRQNTDIHDLWQRNYYEHIIRDEKSYHNISQYIQNNPLNWGKDKFHS
ncbi:hypothetical protein DU508_08080 [Pedobacter chinensis]|uniref:Transposase IS200-like domain-containing protein n=1 Tax=Pedobacter chinensis TaxID=2282421 RepID=A0A369Q490_9SPHI|nr:transposase [Pedobacter chinensis]RDC57138.1 hypothetical protein DU508_08080 [Pedobacter chinensis]